MSDVVVRFDGVGKMYKVFPNRRDNLFDALGLPPLLSRRIRSSRYRQFWALRDIDLELRRGERLGFVGLSRHEIDAACEDIAEFTELGRFLDQSFKTYSQGMQARLSFGIATA